MPWAFHMGYTHREIKQALHRVKAGQLGSSGPQRNPDVRVDPLSGEVFPELEGGGLGDTIGNMYDELA